MRSRCLVVSVVFMVVFLLSLGVPLSEGAASSRAMSPLFLDGRGTVTRVASTVPANGDVNPYGVAIVTHSTGRLVAGDALVSNFNSRANLQGTGTTLVEVSPSGGVRLFARISTLPRGQSCPGGIGLTTALGILPGGWVVVGSLPTSSGGALPEVSPAGCLIVLNSAGTPVETITNPDIAGPWDMALTSSAKLATLFVSNALTGTTRRVDGRPVSGTCTVVRLDLALEGQAPPRLASSTVIGTGYPWDANKAALVLAPTGLALARNGTLYVADAETDSVSAIPAALSRGGAPESRSAPLSSHGSLDAPLGMVIAPDGDIVVVNGNNGNAVEITPGGRQIATVTLVKNGAGDLFGLALAAGGKGILFVNDGTNSLDRYH